MYTSTSFFTNTQAVFKACKTPKRVPNFVSPSGSQYWYGEDKVGAYVIRQSDHWSKGFSKGTSVIRYDRFLREKSEIMSIRKGCGRIASCFWVLFTPKNEVPETNGSGKCYMKNFSKFK